MPASTASTLRRSRRSEPTGRRTWRNSRRIANICSLLVVTASRRWEPLAKPPLFRSNIACATPEVLAKSGLANDAVLIGVGSPSIGDAISVGRSAVANGFSNLLVLPPYYTKEPSDDGLYDYYARLIEAIDHDRLRVYLYHIPQVTAVAITLGLIHRLRKTFGALIVGIKDSSGSFASTKSYAEFDDFEVYPSSEAVLTDAIAIGCKGVISGSTNLSAGLARQVLEASGAERKGSAGETQRFSAGHPKVSSHTCGQAGPCVANR